MITHAPTHGKVRTITPRKAFINEKFKPGDVVPSFEMTFQADGDGGGAWFGHVNGKELRVEPGTEDNHVAVMQLAIEAALSVSSSKLVPGPESDE